jgi:hypothetical protein
MERGKLPRGYVIYYDGKTMYLCITRGLYGMGEKFFSKGFLDFTWVGTIFKQ